MKDNYLSNIKAPVQLLGLAPLMNPLADKVSSQRGTMFSHHAPQAQLLHGCEQPKLFTGFESLIGEYEYSTTERDQGIQILETIPRFIVNHGAYPIKRNPYYTIVFRGDKDGKVGSFQLEHYTMRSNGYGYKNKWLRADQLNRGNFIPQDMKLCTSPAHDGNKYMMGTNLKTVYMSLPGVTEDAFIISESAAKKLSSDSIGKLSFKISPNQIPKDLYGADDEYKFMPDIGEFVRADGVFCALCTPTQDSIISDMSRENLTKVQPLHDQTFYLPPGAEILDIDIVVNRKCRIKTPKEVFSQVQKYRDPINAYNIKIWEAYQEAVKAGREITPTFSSLVYRAISNLLADNVRIPGYNKRADVTLMKKKEAIEFLHITVTYKHVNHINRGHKLTGRSGNCFTVRSCRNTGSDYS